MKAVPSETSSDSEIKHYKSPARFIGVTNPEVYDNKVHGEGCEDDAGAKEHKLAITSDYSRHKNDSAHAKQTRGKRFSSLKCTVGIQSPKDIGPR